MIKYKWLAVLFLFFLMVQPSFADDSAKIHGIYRLGRDILEMNQIIQCI